MLFEDLAHSQAQCRFRSTSSQLLLLLKANKSFWRRPSSFEGLGKVGPQGDSCWGKERKRWNQTKGSYFLDPSPNSCVVQGNWNLLHGACRSVSPRGTPLPSAETWAGRETMAQTCLLRIFLNCRVIGILEHRFEDDCWWNCAEVLALWLTDRQRREACHPEAILHWDRTHRSRTRMIFLICFFFPTSPFPRWHLVP